MRTHFDEVRPHFERAPYPMEVHEDPDNPLLSQCAFCSYPLRERDFREEWNPDELKNVQYAKWMRAHDSWIHVLGRLSIAVCAQGRSCTAGAKDLPEPYSKAPLGFKSQKDFTNAVSSELSTLQKPLSTPWPWRPMEGWKTPFEEKSPKLLAAEAAAREKMEGTPSGSSDPVTTDAQSDWLSTAAASGPPVADQDGEGEGVEGNGPPGDGAAVLQEEADKNLDDDDERTVVGDALLHDQNASSEALGSNTAAEEGPGEDIAAEAKKKEFTVDLTLEETAAADAEKHSAAAKGSRSDEHMQTSPCLFGDDNEQDQEYELKVKKWNATVNSMLVECAKNNSDMYYDNIYFEKIGEAHVGDVRVLKRMVH